MISLVGYTGFVGGNIYRAGEKEHVFDGLYRSVNIQEAYDTHPELLIYAGLRAEKYLANQSPQVDMERIREAEANIRRIQPQKLVLISTIDVFRSPVQVDETSAVETKGLQPYGGNRYQLEGWVRENYPDALIIRLPGLFGQGIKKNFIYDYIHVVPSMLSADKFHELSAREAVLEAYYTLLSNGFYRLNAKDGEVPFLKECFRRVGFSALNFTDSRSQFQFYDLSDLWRDIQWALEQDIRLWHPATEPLTAAELYRYLSGEEFCNHLPAAPSRYDYRTVYAKAYRSHLARQCGQKAKAPDVVAAAEKGYMMSRREIAERIRIFVEESTDKHEAEHEAGHKAKHEAEHKVG